MFKKKNGFIKVAGFMLGAAMLASCMVGGTMAKYVSGATVNAGISVAKWDVRVNEQKFEEAEDVSLKWVLRADGPGFSDREPVPEMLREGKIAPGTWGYAPVKVANKGEVYALVTHNIEKALHYKDSGLTIGVFASDKAPGSSVEIQDWIENFGDGVYLAPGEEKTIYVAFNWTFDTKDANVDAADTKLAQAEVATVLFEDLKLTATQVNSASYLTVYPNP